MDRNNKNSAFERHITACNNARLPAGRRRLLHGGETIGYVDPVLADRLRQEPGFQPAGPDMVLTDPAVLPLVARRFSEEGYYRWRGEAFDVRPSVDAPPVSTIDRGALPAFGVQAIGVHVNGLVRTSDGLSLWVARRAADKALDPSKLDHVVAGGVPAGLTPWDTLIKEAGEEAAIGPSLAARAAPAGRIAYAMMRPEGLRRDVLFCYDLELPPDFTPVPVDGEVAGFELWPIDRVFAVVRDTDDFKFNVNLVLLNLFIRLGMIADADRMRDMLAGGGVG